MQTSLPASNFSFQLVIFSENKDICLLIKLVYRKTRGFLYFTVDFLFKFLPTAFEFSKHLNQIQITGIPATGKALIRAVQCSYIPHTGSSRSTTQSTG